MKEKINLVSYTDEDYEFVYEVRKNAQKKYIEECWGIWIEEDQRTYFEKFIGAVRNNAYIIMNGNATIGFYNGEVLKNGNYEVRNICIDLMSTEDDVCDNLKVLYQLSIKYQLCNHK